MKLAFSTNAFRKYSLTETIKILSDIGYQGVEIMADRPHGFPPDLSRQDITAIRQVLDQTGMKISNINAFMLHAIGDTWKPSWIEWEPQERLKRVEHTKNCIDLAADLGATSLSTEPGGPLEGMLEEEALRIFQEGLEAIADHARACGVKILIEPEPDLLIENSQQFLQFIDRLDQCVFGLNFDIGHFFCVDEDPAELVAALSPYTKHFHLEDISADRKHHHILPGLGSIDIAGVLEAIKKSGYQGFVTVELYPYEDQPISAAEKAYSYLKEFF